MLSLAFRIAAVALVLASLSALAGTPFDSQIDRLQRENERLQDKIDRLQEKQEDAIRQAVQERAAVQEKLIEAASKNVDKQGETINKLINFLQLGLVFASLALAALTFIGLRVIRKWLKERIDEVVTVDFIGNLVHSRGEEAIKKFVASFEDRINNVENDLEALKRLPTSPTENPTPEQTAALEEISQSAQAKKEGQRTYSDWFALGLAHAKAERLDEARLAWEEALKLRPTAIPVIGNLALVAKNQGRTNDAEVLYKRAIELDSKHADSLGSYAVFLKQRERLDEAETFYKSAIEADSRHAINLGNYAVLLDQRERFDEAETFYKRAIEADPTNANSLCNYAVFLNRRQRLDEAETYYTRAIKADPKHASSLGSYAVLLHKRERLGEAEAFFKRGIDADPKHANNLGNYAFFLYKLERLDEAESLYKRAIEADPKNANSLGNYAIFLKQRNRLDEAESFYKRAIEVDPKHANNLGNYAQVLFERGENEAAVIAMHAAMDGATTIPALQIELNFYRYAHCPEERDDALRRIKNLIETGARSKGWDFSRNTERARQDGHPEPDLLEKLANVIIEKSPVADLDEFQAWKTA